MPRGLKVGTYECGGDVVVVLGVHLLRILEHENVEDDGAEADGDDADGGEVHRAEEVVERGAGQRTAGGHTRVPGLAVTRAVCENGLFIV